MKQHGLAVLALALVQLSLMELVGVASGADSLTAAATTAYPDAGDPSTLGVRVLKPMYVRIPQTRDGGRNETAVMTVWLRRVGAAKAPYDMPHQAQVTSPGGRVSSAGGALSMRPGRGPTGGVAIMTRLPGQVARGWGMNP